MSGFSRGVLEALTILLAIRTARHRPVNDFWLVLKAWLGLSASLAAFCAKIT